MLPRIALAERPTPLQHLPRLSQALGAELWVKRDDLTGFGLSGNKVRKLELLLGDALARGADTVITCGGVQSNHARATALACRQLGLRPVLLLRGDPASPPTGNLGLDRLIDADVRWCTREQYASERGALMAALADELRSKGAKPYIVPEGGSNGLGALAFAEAASEAREQVQGDFDGVFVAVGSGGTVTGLALRPVLGPVVGVAVCDDAATFEARAAEIAADASAYGLGALASPGDSWRIDDRFVGAGYGLADAELWALIRLAAQTEGLLLDPVYTGKAFQALAAAAKARPGQRLLFWHTGGAFALFGREGEWA